LLQHARRREEGCHSMLGGGRGGLLQHARRREAGCYSMLGGSWKLKGGRKRNSRQTGKLANSSAR
jgi:hypothetical protein